MGKRKTKAEALLDRLADRPVLAVSRYVAQLRNELCLQHWKIVVQDVGYDAREDPGLETSEDSEALADVTVMQTRHVATLRVFPGYFEANAEGKRHVIAHELLHIKLSELQFAGEDACMAADVISAGHLHRAFLRALERAVDDLAALLAPHLPLPE